MQFGYFTPSDKDHADNWRGLPPPGPAYEPLITLEVDSTLLRVSHPSVGGAARRATALRGQA